MRQIRGLLVVAVVLLGWAGPAVAADFDEGMQAFVERDYKTALEVWTPLAAEGNTQAQFGLGVIFENGHGVAKDGKQAFAWFLKAAEQGDATAQLMVGEYYGRGQDVEYNPIERVRWYTLSARQGNTAARVALAMTFMRHQEVVLAYLWAQRATENVEGKMTAEVDKLIERIKARMTPEQIADGDRRVEKMRKAEADGTAPAVTRPGLRK